MAPPALPPLTHPPSLNHFVIFCPKLSSKHSDGSQRPETLNSDDKVETYLEEPTVKSEHHESVGDQARGTAEEKERDHDLEDDLREASQILFYTSRSSGSVSRDTMLRQVGLVKGLMGFTDMVSKSPEEAGHWSFRSHRSRMLVWSPEPDILIYLNVFLARTDSPPDSKEREGEPTATAQGLSDNLLLDGLKRGYEDFQLLNGEFTDLLPPSPSSISKIDKFWTKFAFEFESTYLTSSSQDPLSTSIQGYPRLSERISNPITQSLNRLLEQNGEIKTFGLITKDGLIVLHPLSPALMRYLNKLVQASLPRPVEPAPKQDTRQTLGVSLNKWSSSSGERKGSWAGVPGFGWVPGLGSGNSSRSVTPSKQHRSTPSTELKPQSVDDGARRGSGQPAAGKEVAEGEGEKWSFGMSGISNAMESLGSGMGNVGNIFKFGSPNLSSQPEQTPSAAANAGEPLSTGPDPVNVPSYATKDQTLSVASPVIPDSIAESSSTPRGSVEQSRVAIPDLQDAFQADNVDLGWTTRTFYLPNSPTSVEMSERRVSWVIRDNVLFYIITSPTSTSYPSNEAVLKIYVQLRELTTPAPMPIAKKSSMDSIRNQTISNPWIVQRSEIVEKAGEIDSASSSALADMKDWMQSDCSLEEVYGKTSASKIVIAKHFQPSHTSNEEGTRVQRVNGESAGAELYMVIGRKDTNLSDAEHTLRGLLRAKPNLVK